MRVIGLCRDPYFTPLGWPHIGRAAARTVVRGAQGGSLAPIRLGGPCVGQLSAVPIGGRPGSAGSGPKFGARVSLENAPQDIGVEQARSWTRLRAFFQLTLGRTARVVGNGAGLGSARTSELVLRVQRRSRRPAPSRKDRVGGAELPSTGRRASATSWQKSK